MKTFTRMIGRYVLATAVVVLLVVGLLLGTVVYLGLHYGAATDSRIRIGTLAEALTPTADGLQLDPARTPADWLQGYAWAMVLDDDGSVIWQHDLPQNLNKHYTASEIASFSRWYLDDWPVFCWTADYGLFVAAVPRGSVWKYNICNNEQLMSAMAAGMLPALALLLGVAAACCLLFSWRGARRLQTIAAGLATVADGGTIRLPTDGFAGELADTVNRTSEQLRRRNEIIARRDDARTSWIAGVSHDVRTPLALMQTRLELFAAEHRQMSEETAKLLHFQQEQVERLSALVRTLLEMSDLRSVPRTDRIDLAPMVEEVLVDLTPLAQKNGITLMQTGENVQFIGSDVLLYRLLFNLTENAIKYNRTDGSVEVSVEREGGQAAIRVRDTGPGIAEEYRDSIFQPFFRVDKSRSRAMGGVGLGLALVQEIVRLHGGTVRVEQSADTGTTILVTLPVGKAA